MDSSQKIIKIICELESYLDEGYMDYYAIKEVIRKLKEVYDRESYERLNKMMEEVTNYMINQTNQEKRVYEFVKENIGLVAKTIGKSDRTVYRKISNRAFTLSEKTLIEQLIYDLANKEN